HFVGGRVHGDVPRLGNTYSVELWFWNGLPNDARADTGCLYSRPSSGDDKAGGDYIGINRGNADVGKLYFSNGNSHEQVLKGQSTIVPKTWNHLVVVRDENTLRAYLNGQPNPEIEGESPTDSNAAGNKWFFGGRNDASNSLEGKLSDVA